VFCEKCGAHIEEDSVFCEQCGHKQSGFQPQMVDYTPGSVTPIGMSAGSASGASARGSSQNSGQIPDQSQNPNAAAAGTGKLQTSHFILMGVVAVLAIVLVIVLFTRPPVSSDNSGVNVNTADTVYEQENQGNYDSGSADYNNSGELMLPEETFAPASNACIMTVDVSGNIPDSGSRTFNGRNTIDGNPDTCWLVNTEEAGASGAWIRYGFDDLYTVSGIKMINGNVYKDNFYFINGHIREFRLEFSDGTTQTFTAREIESRTTEDNVFYLDEPVTTSYIKLTIISSYIASKEAYRTNSAMAEFVVF